MWENTADLSGRHNATERIGSLAAIRHCRPGNSQMKQPGQKNPRTLMFRRVLVTPTSLKADSGFRAPSAELQIRFRSSGSLSASRISFLPFQIRSYGNVWSRGLCFRWFGWKPSFPEASAKSCRHARQHTELGISS